VLRCECVLCMCWRPLPSVKHTQHSRATVGIPSQRAGKHSVHRTLREGRRTATAAGSPAAMSRRGWRRLCGGPQNGGAPHSPDARNTAPACLAGRPARLPAPAALSLCLEAGVHVPQVPRQQRRRGGVEARRRLRGRRARLAPRRQRAAHLHAGGAGWRWSWQRARVWLECVCASRVEGARLRSTRQFRTPSTVVYTRLLREHLAQLHAPLVKRRDVPHKALHRCAGKEQRGRAWEAGAGRISGSSP
jgi:hypothetical protein